MRNVTPQKNLAPKFKTQPIQAPDNSSEEAAEMSAQSGAMKNLSSLLSQKFSKPPAAMAAMAGGLKNKKKKGSNQ